MQPLRPLGLGELIDRATSVWRAAWKPLFILALPFELVQFIALKAVNLAIVKYFPAMKGDAAALSLLKNDPVAGVTQAASALALFVAAIVLAWWFSQVASLATTHLLAPRVLNTGAPDLSFALKATWPHLRALSGTFALSAGYGALISIVTFAPGAALVGLGLTSDSNAAVLLVVAGAAWIGLASLVLLVWYVIRFLVVPQVIGVENANVFKTFRRSGTLTSGRIGPSLGDFVKLRLTVLLTIVGGMLTVIGLVSAVPQLLLGLVYGASLAPGHTVEEVVPQALLVPSQLLQIGLSSLVAPLFDALKVMYYVDMRVRREGLDLTLQLS